jgi:outer membrane protein insertion porin family
MTLNIKKMLSCVLFSPLFFFAQAEIVNTIDVQGLQLVSLDAISAYITISVGQDVDSNDIRAQVTTLYETGLFQQIEIKVSDYEMVIYCTEQPVLQSIKVDDENGVLPEDQVKKQLEAAGIIKAELLNESVVEEFRVMTEYSLKQYGFSNAEIATKIESVGDNVAILHIHIKEGESTKLKSIKFEGDLKLPERELRALLGSQTTGLLSFYTRNDLFSEQRLSEDRDRLVSYYQSKGYLAPSIQLLTEPTVPFQRMWNSDYQQAVFDIDTGPKFYVDSVNFENTNDEWPDELKVKILNRVNGRVLDREVHSIVRDELLQHYKDDEFKDFYVTGLEHEISGYDKVHIRLNLVKTISNVRYISFHGNYVTYDEPLRRALLIEEAKPFNASMLAQTHQSLLNLGYLKSANITPIKVGENEYDIDIEIKEASTLQGDMNFDFGSGPWGLSFNAADPNAFGTGNNITLSVSGNLEKQQISASYIQPNFTLSRHHLTNSLSYVRQSKEDKNNMSYHVDSFNYISGYSIPVSYNFRFDFGGGILFDQYYGVEKASSIIRDFFEDQSSLVEQYKLSAGFSYRDIDSSYMPTQGLTFDFSSSATIPYRNSLSYYQIIAEGRYYYKINEMFDQPIVLRTRLLGKHVDDYSNKDKDVAFFARHTCGGLGTVRGYSGMGPLYKNQIRKETVDKDTNETVIVVREVDALKGGTTLLVANAEIQLPSLLPDYITPYLYVDMGNVFDDSESISIGEMRGSAGMSATVKTPMMTFTTSFGIPFNNKSTDNFSPFSFGVGVMF